jgi:hypothetical protein
VAGGGGGSLAGGVARGAAQRGVVAGAERLGHL